MPQVEEDLGVWGAWELSARPHSTPQESQASQGLAAQPQPITYTVQIARLTRRAANPSTRLSVLRNKVASKTPQLNLQLNNKKKS
jgi:hypothetical protein